MTDERSYQEIIASLPQVMKYKDTGSRIPLLQKVLDAAGAPDLTFKTIHICGTNGKGSTSEMVSRLLQGTGLDVGVFSSPPMYDDREQIKLNGELISKSNFVESYQKLESAFSSLKLTQTDFSVFETWYLVSAIYFSNKHVQYVVYECGLGGEFDATNATRNVESAVFTKIDMDHMNILGPTIEDIATTKSKIIKPGIKVISYPKQSSKVEPIIQAEADRQHATLFNNSSNNVALEEEHLTYSIVSLWFKNKQYEDVYFNLGGLYQLTNLQNVLNWVEVYNQSAQEKIKIDNIKSVLQRITLPGRMDLIQKNPKTVIDGAHNINAIKGLVDSITRLKLTEKLIFVVGFLADKEYKKCVDKLLELPATFIITSPDNHERALPAPDLMKIFEDDPEHAGRNLILATSISDAVKTAKEIQQDQNGLVICTGSFYLINKIEPLWNKK